MRVGQSWSMDIVIAVVVFGFVALAITGFVLLSQPDAEQLERNSQVVISNLAAAQAGCDPVMSGNNVHYEALSCLMFNTDYDMFRDELGIQGDFCIFLEDEQGQLWEIRKDAQNSSSDRAMSWGRPDVNVAGSPCGKIV